MKLKADETDDPAKAKKQLKHTFDVNDPNPVDAFELFYKNRERPKFSLEDKVVLNLNEEIRK